MLRRVAAVLLVALAAIAAGATAEGAKAPIGAESLLAAGIPWTTVRDVAGPEWWPGVPQFETPPLFRRPLPKHPRVVTSQWYVRPGSDRAIQTTLFAFPGTAGPDVCPLVAEEDGVPVNGNVPAVGSNHVFWTPGDSVAPVTIFCFERGPVAVEIKVIGEKWSAAKVARLARPVDASLEALVAGRLAVPPVPAALLARLPSSADAPGKPLGTAVVPAEAWASNASDPTPQQLLAKLNRGGSRTLLVRRYLLSDGTNVIDLTLFSFASEAAATGWFDTLAAASALGSTDLPPPATGSHTTFRGLEEYYVLDFVAGRAVADATCYAPYGEKPSGGCVAALRKLGARWYSQLARA